MRARLPFWKRKDYRSIDIPLAPPGVMPVPRKLSKVYDPMGKEVGLRISVVGDFAPPVDLRFFEMTPEQMHRILTHDVIEQDRTARREIQRLYQLKHRQERGSDQAA